MENKTEITTSPKIKDAYNKIVSNELIKKSLQFIEHDHEQTIKDQIEITEIPAPPFNEEKRANYIMQLFKNLNLEDVTMDDEGNVYGKRSGIGNGPKVFISAHLDTVFPEGTDTKVKEKDGVLYAPGITDDTRGVAELLAIIRTINEFDIQNIGDIIFGGTVGEEGMGDLRGVKAFFSEHENIDAFISIDGSQPNHIVYNGTGSFRYRVTYKGHGGHSYGAFGIPSATHALGRAIAKISNIKTKENPKTTFTVGKVWGGTAINAIAAEAGFYMDLRSNDQAELKQLESQFLKIVHTAMAEENERWGEEQLTITVDKIGDRPSASQSSDSIIVQTAWCAIEGAGNSPKLSIPSSTDSNYPMSLGIPSVTLSRGGTAGNEHTLHEWHNPKDGHKGIQNSFLTLLGLIGVKNISPALILLDGNN